jgi:hypothetical protein
MTLRWNGFGGSALFAAAAAAAFVPWLAVVGPAAGNRRAVAVYLVLATAT